MSGSVLEAERFGVLSISARANFFLKYLYVLFYLVRVSSETVQTVQALCSRSGVVFFF